MPDYGKKTVAELLEILKGRSLPHNGKKAELVARLNEADKSADAKTAETAPPPPASAPEPTAKDVAPIPDPPPVPAAKASQESATSTRATEQPTAPATQIAQADREGSANTDTKLANATDYSMGLNQSSYDDELRKRKARAERFGAPAEEVDTEGQKKAERAKKFGTADAANGGVGKLDEALPMERERKGKRSREAECTLEDPGLKQGRGGKRRFPGRDGRNTNRGEKPTGVQKAVSRATGIFSSEKDRLAAEARKKKFATA